MIKNFNEKEKEEIKELFEALQWYNGSVDKSGDIQRMHFFDIDLANKIFNNEIKVKDISKKDYDEMIFALESTQDFCVCVTGAEDSLQSKFLQLLKEHRDA